MAAVGQNQSQIALLKPYLRIQRTSLLQPGQLVFKILNHRARAYSRRCDDDSATHVLGKPIQVLELLRAFVAKL